MDFKASEFNRIAEEIEGLIPVTKSKNPWKGLPEPYRAITLDDQRGTSRTYRGVDRESDTQWLADVLGEIYTNWSFRIDNQDRIKVSTLRSEFTFRADTPVTRIVQALMYWASEEDMNVVVRVDDTKADH